MSKLKNNKGITLVALIITIIVLLILAMVSINLVMNGGIIDKSKSAVDKYSEEEIQEQIKLAYAEWQTAQFTGETRTAQKFMEDRLRESLKDNGLTVTGAEGVFTVTFADGKEYSYNVTTGTTAKVAKWNDNGDGTWTHSETGSKIQIGDIVNYDPTKDENGNTLTTTYTSYAEANAAANKNEGRTSGYTTDQSFSVSATTNGWRVLGVNADGQIELISADPITPLSIYYYSLKGEKGYFDGPAELNAICSIFGQGKGAESARSLNVEDINKLAGIKTEADIKSMPYSIYGSKWKYRFPESGSRLQYNKDTGSGYSDTWTNIGSTNSNDQKFRMPGAAASTEINSSNPGESPELTYTYYGYSISSKITQANISNLILRGTTSSNIVQQYLADSCLVCDTYYSASFGIRTINFQRLCKYGYYSHCSWRRTAVLAVIPSALW